MANSVIQTSFSAGELSPKLYARVDLEKYGSGAALLRNMFVDYRGGASNRAGTKFIGRTKSNATGDARLIPFIFSTDQAYILEVGNQYIRFIANEAYLTEATTTITGVTQADPAVVTNTAHGYTTGNEVEIEDVSGMTELNGKNFIVTVLSANTYSLHDLNGNNINSTAFTTYTSGGTAARVYTLASPYTTAELPLLKYTQDANTLTFVHHSHPPYDLTRTSSTSFSLTQVVFGPTLAAVGTTTITQSNEPDIKSAYSYTVFAVDKDGKEGSVAYPYFQVGSILNQTTGVYNYLSWVAIDDAVSYRIYKAGPWASVHASSATPPTTTFGFIGTASGTTFVDVNIAPDYSQSPPEFVDPVSPGQISQLKLTTVGSGYSTSLFDIPLVFTGGGGSGATGYALVDPNNGQIADVILLNPGHGYTTAPVVTDSGHNAATYTATLGPLTGTYPAAVGYYQQRRFYGGTDNFPEAFFASQTGAYNNFDTNTILLDSDALSASIASRQVNAIKSFTSMPTGLVVLTTGGGFLVSGGGGGSAITPTNIVALQQPSSGCNDLPPLVVNQDILYCQNRGFVVRDLAFSFYTQSYLGTDRSVLASHLFENFLPIDWTYAEQPYRQILTVRSDGRMLAFTYVPEQEMFAWSQYDTQGLFLSVASIPEGDVNAVYVLVKRHVVNPAGGECWVNYVERMDPRLFDCILEAWFLDCALEYPRTFPDETIYLSVVDDVATITAFDPCLTEPGGTGPFSGSGTIYTLNGYNPVGGALETLVATNDPSLFVLQTDQQYMGHSYDPITRRIYFSASALVDSVPAGTGFSKINNTANVLFSWVDDFGYSPGETYNGVYDKNFYLCYMDIDTQAVTMIDAHDPAATIPNGIFGSDGTWRMMVGASVNGDDPAQFKLVDPRTADVWVHMTVPGCDIYVFRDGEGYTQQLLPFGLGGHMEMLGITDDWVLVMSSTNTKRETGVLYTVPRLTTADEITNGQLLGYFNVAQLSWMDSAYWRSILTPSGTLYIFGSQRSGTRDYRLIQYDPPPTVGSWMGSSQPGGTFTDITPWSASTGPNTNCAAWTANSTAGANADKQLYWQQQSPYNLPATNQLAFLSILTPQKVGVSTNHDPADFRVDCTYFDITGSTFDYQEGFVTGYMTSEWDTTADPTAASFAVQFIRELDTYRELNAHDYADDYSFRWIAFTVQPVVAGVFTWDATGASNSTVLALYKFEYGSAPSLQQVQFDESWLAFYATYAGAIGNNNVVEQSIKMHGEFAVPGVTFNETEFYLSDTGFYDASTNHIWFGGYNAESILIDPTVPTYRGTYTPGSQPLPLASAFVRLGWGTGGSVDGDILQVGCGKVLITSTVDSWTVIGTITSPLDVALPDDPEGLLAPVSAGEWSLATPVTAVTGLDYLEGKIVYALADGVVRGPFTVAAGSITLSTAATNIIVGLKYQSQLKTLELDVGNPTIQGKRKQIAATTARLNMTAGLKAGRTFAGVVPMKECAPTTPPSLHSSDARTIINAAWDKPGQVCYQQDDPLPVTILGVIPEVVVGDTGK